MTFPTFLSVISSFILAVNIDTSRGKDEKRFASLALSCEFLFSRAKKGTKKALFRYHGDIRSECNEYLTLILMLGVV